MAAGTSGRDFLSDQKVTKESPGDAFDEHLAYASAHRRLSPGPPIFTRACPFGLCVISGGLSFDRASLSTRATGPLCHQNLKAFPLYHTPPGACLPVRCGGGRANASATARLPRFCQGRRCPYNADTPKFLVRRPQWAVARKTVRPGFARRMNIPSPQEGVPRNRGLGGKPPMSAASGIALIEGDPQRIFGYFLCEQKVTPALPRRAELSPKPTPFP